MLQQIENPQTVPPGELRMLRLIDDGLGGKQGMTKDKIRQVRVVQRHRPQEQRFFLSSDPQGQPAVIFNCSSRQAIASPQIVYTFK
jgi:hypothetical protein